MGEVFRFLHLADVHLDTPFRARRPELRRRLRQAGWESFAAALARARAEACDAVIVAGDIFDEDRVAPGSETRLLTLLGETAEAGVAVVLATGNHDPGGDAGRLGALRFPSGVTCFRRRKPARLTLTRGGQPLAHVLGVGHETAREAESLATFPSRPGPEPTVAVMHALVTSAEGAASHDRYAPCDVSQLEAFDGDYWALGHVHTRQRVCRAPAAWYPGNLQGRHFGETGARGGLLVEIPRKGQGTRPPQVRFLPLARVRWEEIVLDDLGEARLALHLLERFDAAWAERRREIAATQDPATGFMLRLRLRGPCPLTRLLTDEDERRDLAAQLAERGGGALWDLELDTSGLRNPRDLPALRARDDLLGESLRALDLRATAADPWGNLIARPQRLASRAARLNPASLAEGVDEILAEAFGVEDEA